ncbi:MAG: N-6 DNA methylase [Bradyrhizobium sp.]
MAKAEGTMHFCERLLGTLPNGERASSLDPRTLVHRQRSLSCGTYSTPGVIARQVSRDLLTAIRSNGKRTADIADLSLEAGHFALSSLAENTSLRVRFFGMDRDAVALQLAQWIIKYAKRESGDRAFEFCTSQQDSILDPLPRRWPQVFDAIVGNPPWKTRHATDAQHYRTAFGEHLFGSFDVYLAFILQAHKYLKPRGFMAMVLPSQFLFNQNAEPVRELLLSQYNFLRLDVYPRRSFVELPSVAPVAFLAQKRDAQARHGRTRVSYGQADIGHSERPRSRTSKIAELWSKLPGNAIHPLVQRDNIFLAHINTAKSLADLGNFSCGARLGNQTASPQSFVGFHGRHIKPFCACRRHAIRYRSDQIVFDRLPRIEYASRSKILFQDVRCMTLATRLIAAQVGKGMMAVSSASMFIPHDVGHVNALEALLNSQFANAWYKLRDTSRSIKLSILEKFPIVPDAARWNNLAKIGRDITRIRAAQQCGHAGNVTNCYSSAQTSEELADFEALLNSEIFSMYGLTARQRIATAKLSTARVF